MLSGQCMCGEVRIEFAGRIEHQAEACHCSQCRKQSGHFLAAVNLRTDALSIKGEDKVSWYRSSEQVKRGFCSRCGSTLFWQPLIDGYEFTAVAIGLFDKPTGIALARHTFVGDKGDYYELSDGVPTSDGY